MLKEITLKATGVFIFLTLVCGVIYPAVMTGVGSVFFPQKAAGSLIEVDGKVYGSELVGQPFSAPNHLWGRPVSVDIETFKDDAGTPLLYGSARNLSPLSEEFEKSADQRAEEIKTAHPEQKNMPVPVDLITESGSGLDPHISPAAAYYQIPRLAKATGKSENEIKAIIDKNTSGRMLGIFGEETVNVLKVNLMLDGVLH